METYTTFATEITKAQCLEALKEHTLMEAAKTAGLTYRTFYRAIIALGLHGKKCQVLNLSKRDLEEYIRGYSWTCLARMFSCSTTMIRRQFRLKGVVKKDERVKRKFIGCRLKGDNG